VADTGDPSLPDPQIKNHRPRWWAWSIGAVKRKVHERRKKIEQESVTDRATRRTTTATIWMAIFTVVLAVVSFSTLLVLRKQLVEMQSGGVDTKKLATAADNQATWTQSLANSAGTQADRTKDLADRMKDQADRTRDLAVQATIQANATKVAAEAAKRAADIADDSLHMSQRAYLITGVPVDDLQNGRANLPIYNVGHVSSGLVKIVIHEMTARIDDPYSTVPTPSTAIIERHWHPTTYQSVPAIPAVSVYGVEIEYPKAVQDDLKNGRQRVLSVVVMTYNDGFPNTPDQTWVSCEGSSYIAATKEFAMRPCDDPNAILKSLITLDGYPNPQYEEK
jgi:hypothetical protein